MKKGKISWKDMDKLASDYSQLIKRINDEAIPKEIRENYGKQAEMQKMFIVENLYPYMFYVAIKILSKKGYELRREDKIIKLKFSAPKEKYKEIKEEMAQEGILETIRVIERYSPEKGGLATFIGQCAASRMFREAKQNYGLSIPLEFPVNFSEGALQKCSKGIFSEFYDNEEDTAIKVTNVKKKDINLSNMLLSKPVWFRKLDEINKKVLDRDNLEISSFDYVYNKERKKKIKEILSTLTPREETAIKLRFGVGEEDEHTLEEAGKKMNVTRERVRQLETRALRKLKHPSRKRALEKFI